MKSKKSLTRSSRLQVAGNWISKYEGKNIIKGYSKHFAVDKLCAVKELEMLGYKFESEYINRLIESLEGQQKAIQRRKLRNEKKMATIIETYSDERFYYIAGYTSGGAPYGITWEEIEPFAGESNENIESER